MQPVFSEVSQGGRMPQGAGSGTQAEGRGRACGTGMATSAWPLERIGSLMTTRSQGRDIGFLPIDTPP